MNYIKTYEAYIDKQNDDYLSDNLSDNEDNIDSFLDDLKDISLGFYKDINKRGYWDPKLSSNCSTNKSNIIDNIFYAFAFKNYDNKKEEIDIYLEEIESACESINVKFKVVSYIPDKIKNMDFTTKTDRGEIINFIILDFHSSYARTLKEEAYVTPLYQLLLINSLWKINYI